MRRLSLFIFTLCLFASSALAQSSPTGNLVGTVAGPDGVIPGATVTVIDEQTQRERVVVTNSEGAFRVPQLDVGEYTVRVTASGFSTFIATDVKIDVGRDYSLNPTLAIGRIEETVTVTAGSDVLNATNAEIQTTVSKKQIEELPLNGRNPLNLIQLQAGTTANGATSTSINGQRTSYTNITRDGINIQDNFIRSNATTFAPQRPGVDDVGEFTLTTQNAGAEQGYGSSQVQLVTPRGQSDIHGALYIFNRNSKFAANEFFNNASRTPRPFLNRNQFGGKLSGPLPLPRFGEGGRSLIRDKAYFFVSYEGFRERTQSPELRTILLPQARQGLFTYRDNSGVTRQINLFSLPISGTNVPTGVDPLIQSRILARSPSAGNTTEAGDQLNTTGFRFNQTDNTDRDNFTMRLDFDISERHTINGVFGYGDESNDRPDIDVSFDVNPQVVQPATRKFLAVGYRWTPTATFTNELRGGLFMSEPTFRRTLPLPAFKLSIPLISSPETNFEDQGRKADTYSIQNNSNFLWGNHSFRFGGQAQFFRVDSFAGFDTAPVLTLGTNINTPSIPTSVFTNPAFFPGGISTSQRNNANSLLALLGGIVSSADQTFNITSRDSGFVPGAAERQTFAYENMAFYFSDQWRATPALTLNLGVRYEIYPALRETRGLMLEPVFGGRDPVAAILDPNGTYNFVGGNSGEENQFFRTDKNNIAPVVSFAWSPRNDGDFLSGLLGSDGRTVVRGGYRISYVNDEFVRSADNALGGNRGLSADVELVGLNARLSSPPAIPVPTFQVPRTYAQNNALQGGFGTVFAVDPDLEVPMTQEWNIGIQRELGFQTALELRYVGGKSDNLSRAIDFNQVDIFNNGFAADFIRARNNLVNFGDPRCSAAQAQTRGCQVLTVFPNLLAGGLLTNSTIQGQLISGTPGQLALIYKFFGFETNAVQFAPNINTGVADLLGNFGKYRYHSFQAELRRRFSRGFYFQANYTFQKTLTDASGVGQTNFEPNLANQFPQLEYARADYDQTHIFNFNTIYELPFGQGKRWLNDGGFSDHVFGGWQLTSIVRIASGAPLTIRDPRGTLNRTGRSSRQTPFTTLSKEEIKNLIGVFRTPCGVFYINPSVININQQALAAGQCGNLGTGRGAEGFGSTPFNGQVFFNVAPGQTGNLERAFINGPLYLNWDASIIKNIRMGENTRLQLRAEAFNVLNRANFFVGNFGNFDINSSSFGRITSTFSPRILQFGARFEF